MSAETTALEVFGTKEVSVKEFMGSSDKSLVLLSDYEKAKANLEELKKKHQSRVEEFVAVEKLSPEENKELNSIRAELREPRYLIQNIEKNNISVFEAYKKTDKANLKSLIEINVSLEDKATAKLQAEEQRKREEKEAEAKAEELRVERIKTQIDNIETYCYEVIQKMNFENLKISTDIIEKTLNAENDFEEYDLLLDQVKERVAKQLLDKTNDITARENQRLENEAMKLEIFQVRVNRFKEIGFVIDDNDVFRSTELSHTYLKSELLNIDSATFERAIENLKQAKEELEKSKRDAELKQQKDEQFEIRKNRLEEIEVILEDDNGFQYRITDANNLYVTTRNDVYDASVTEFEKILSKAKRDIADAKEQKELADKKARIEKRELMFKQINSELGDGFELIQIHRGDKTKFELTKEQVFDSSDEEFSKLFEQYKKEYKSFKEYIEKEAEKKSDAENKARVKRLAKDKEVILKSFEVYFSDLHLESENEETKHFISFANLQIKQLKADLLTQLNEM